MMLSNKSMVYIALAIAIAGSPMSPSPSVDATHIGMAGVRGFHRAMGVVPQKYLSTAVMTSRIPTHAVNHDPDHFGDERHQDADMWFNGLPTSPTTTPIVSSEKRDRVAEDRKEATKAFERTQRQLSSQSHDERGTFHSSTSFLAPSKPISEETRGTHVFFGQLPSSPVELKPSRRHYATVTHPDSVAPGEYSSWLTHFSFSLADLPDHMDIQPEQVEDVIRSIISQCRRLPADYLTPTNSQIKVQKLTDHVFIPILPVTLRRTPYPVSVAQRIHDVADTLLFPVQGIHWGGVNPLKNSRRLQAFLVRMLRMQTWEQVFADNFMKDHDVGQIALGGAHLSGPRWS